MTKTLLICARLTKKILFPFLLAGLCAFASAATVTWTGGGDGSSWSDAANWDTDSVPVGGDSIQIPAGLSSYPTIDSAVTVDDITIESGASVTIGASGILEMNVSSATTIPELIVEDGGTLKNSGAVMIAVEKLSGTAIINNAGISPSGIFISGYDTATPPKVTTAGSNCLFAAGTIGALTVGNSITQINGDLTIAGSLELLGTGSILQGNNAGGRTLTVQGNITNNVGAQLNRSNKIAKIVCGGNWTNNGTFTATDSLVMSGSGVKFAGGGATYASFEYSGGGAITVEGDNTFSDFKCTAGGSVISFAAGSTQTAGAFNIDGGGTLVALKSTVDGSEWNLVTAATTSADYTTRYLSVRDSNASNAFIYATYAADLSGNTNWNFAGSVYHWSGANSSVWNERTNWAEGSVPGPDAAAVIPVVAANYPDISSEEKISSLQIGEAPESEARFIISGTDNFVVTGGAANLVNYGIIVYKDSGRIVDAESSPNIINDISSDHEGSVEYSGNTVQTLTDFGTADYYNLILASDKLSAATDINVLNKTTVAADSVFDCGTNSLTFGGALDSASGQNNALSVTAGTINFAGDVGETDSLSALTVNGAALISSAVVSFNCGSGAIVFNETVDGASEGSSSLTINGDASGSVTFKAAVGNSAKLNSLECNAQLFIDISSGGYIGTVSAQAYNADVTLNVDTSFDGSSVEVNAGLITSGSIAATFLPDLYISGSSGAVLGGGDETIVCNKNIFFAGDDSKTVTVDSPIAAAENILLFGGTVTLNRDIRAAKDIILLGSGYNIDDTDPANSSPSGVAGLFAYNHASRPAAASYTAAFPSGTFSGNLTSAGVNITAGKNFYANGITINGINIYIQENDVQTASFAEIYNSIVTNCRAYYSGTATEAFIAAAENNSVDASSSGFATMRPLIDSAYTVFDDVIYVSFKYSDGTDVVIENSNGEIAAALENIQYYSEGALVGYGGVFEDAEFLTEISSSEDVSGGFYLRAAGNSAYKWNTDAAGNTPGTDDSSDMSGTHRSAIPYINLPKALDALYETLRDNHKNRITHYYSANPPTGTVSSTNSAAGATYTAVTDNTRPVLVAAYTGQEVHTDGSGQKDYDAHNFIELRYSEPVSVGDIAYDDSGVTNIQVQAGFDSAAEHGGAIVTDSDGSGLTVTGFGKFSDGALVCGQGGSESTTVHAIYRNFARMADESAADYPCRVRISIAGYVDGTAGAYKNWAGYISSATVPKGTFTSTENSFITDAAGNALMSTAETQGTVNHRKDALNVNALSPAASDADYYSSLYGPKDNSFDAWDIIPPSFAPKRINGTDGWTRPATDGTSEYESVGACYSGSTLSAIEVHVFDNEPKYSSGDSYQWFSRIGWATAASASATSYSSVYSAAADTLGGSRARASADSGRTSGGIRYCTIYNSQSAFRYSIADAGSYTGFTRNIVQGAESSLFSVAAGSGNAVDAADGHYFKLLLDDNTLSASTTFDIEFNSEACYITDLAGNRIQCGTIIMKTIDRTPPRFNLTAAPLGMNKMLVIFSKALETDTLRLYTDAATPPEVVSALEYIPKSLEIDSAASGLAVDQSVPAEVAFKAKKSTGLIITLTQEPELSDITSGIYLKAVSEGTRFDPLTGINASVTYIQDSTGNYVVPDSRHALSDFAVNAVLPQYAYDNSLTDSGDVIGIDLYGEGSHAVHDWNAEQSNYGTLLAGKEIIMQAKLADGISETVTGFFDATPDAASVSTGVNSTSSLTWRIWLPALGDAFGSLADANNTDYFSMDGENTASNDFSKFDIAASDSEIWKSGEQVSFLFKLGDYEIDHFGDGTCRTPLYCLRLKNSGDLTSLDLWSFKLKNLTLQRGGVTILNNVINVNTGEKTTVRVDMAESGNLNVIVMTLDGNIVTYLQHGRADAGTHYYTWNGRNNGGSPVARGLYFVRVIGPGIDETRKVMCVK